MKDRIQLDELKTNDRDVYVILKDDGTYADMFKDSVVVSFEREEAHTSTVIYNVVIERNKLEPGTNEIDIREKMRAFGLERLKSILSGQEKYEETTSPEGYLFTNKRWKIQPDPLMGEEYRKKISRILNSTIYQRLIRAAEELFPSPDSSLITETIKCFSRMLIRMDTREFSLYPAVRISRTDSDAYLSLLDDLYGKLSIQVNSNSHGLIEDIRDVIREIDKIHIEYDFRSIDPELIHPTLSKVEQSISLLDELHKKKPQLDEVLAFLESFSKSKDQARQDIIGNAAKVFDRRSSGINTKRWLWGGYILAAVTFLYMLSALTHFHIPYLSGSEWFSMGNDGESLYSNIIVRIAIFSILSYVTIFCFRQYVYERKTKEVYEFKQTALNAMVGLLDIHQGNQDQTNQIMTHSLPHIFSDSNVNSEKHQPTDTNQSLLFEMMKLIRQQK